MGLPSELKNVEEKLEFLAARVTYLEEVLKGVYASFPSDFDALAFAQIESSSLPTSGKTSVNAVVAAHKEKLKAKP